MTRDEVIALARKAGFQDGWLELWSGNFLHFAALATAKDVVVEREACAKVAEEFLTKGRSPLGKPVAAAIRARGEK